MCSFHAERVLVDEGNRIRNHAEPTDHMKTCVQSRALMLLPVALLLTVLTGFAGLVYEVVWQKYLAVLLGSQGEATAAVLAIFLGGLSGGYALFGHLTRVTVERAQREQQPARLLSLYAWVEGGIGFYALLFPSLFGVAQAVSLLGPIGHEGLGFAFDVLLSALLIGPPAVLMGGTIPILTLALAGDAEHATRVHAWVYGSNTIGAFAGAIAGGFLLVPQLGLDGTVFAMAALNLVAAGVFFGLDSGSPVSAEAGLPNASEPVAHFPAWAGAAALAGFAMMALQTTLNRISALALGSSQFTFSMIVAVFVLCIALGSLAVSAMSKVPRQLVLVTQWLLVVLLFPLYFVLEDAGYFAHTIRAVFRGEAPAFFAYHGAVFSALLALFFVPIGLSGMLLPLLFDALRREVRDLGSVAGRLYAWNTLGSLLGSLLGGYLMLFVFDLHHVYRASMLALTAMAVLLTLLVSGRQVGLRAGAAGAVVTLVILLGLPAWSPKRLSAGLFRTEEPTAYSWLGPDAFFAAHSPTDQVIFYDDDPTMSVAVRETKVGNGDRWVLVNGKSDGSLRGDYATTSLLGLIPALMADDYQRSFVVGWGTGTTAGELGALDRAGEVQVAEISRAVIEAAPLFEYGNQQALANPKISLRRGDAYRTLLRSDGQFDVIVSEPSNPWVTGVEMLYSKEFLEAARARLAPGGVYAQWFHLYETDAEVAQLVLRTYAEVFPHVSVWFTRGYDVVLLGFDRAERALDVEAIAKRFAQPDFRAAFGRVGIRSLPQLLAHEMLPLGTVHALPMEGEIHTLRHPRLSDVAARAFFRGQMAWLPHLVKPEHQRVSRSNALLRRFAGGNDPLPEPVLEVAALETCRNIRMAECAALFARWQVDWPGSPQLDRALARARTEAGNNSIHIGPGVLQPLVALHRRGAGTLPAELPVATASDLTNRFLTHYHHAVPFDRRALDDLWGRCRGPGCAQWREQARVQVGITPAGASPPSLPAAKQ